MNLLFDTYFCKGEPCDFYFEEGTTTSALNPSMSEICVSSFLLSKDFKVPCCVNKTEFNAQA